MMEQIVYVYRMDRAPTLEDRANKIGLEEFIKELREHGWVDSSSRITALKRFRIRYEGHEEPGNNYVRWSAVLKE